MSAPLPSRSPDPRSSLDWARDAQLGPELARAIRHTVARRRRRRLVATAAAGLFAMATLSFWLPGHGTPSPSLAASTHGSSTTVVVPQRQTLEDGSIVELKPGAEIRVDYSVTRREVALLRGEAHFQVAKNPQRPFVVTVRGAEVRAVGTAFSVGVDARAIEVLVTEGVVALTPPASAREGRGPNDGDEQMTAGQHATMELTTAAVPLVRSMTPAQLSQRLSWRVPRLQFSGTPLAEVIGLFRTLGGVNVVLADPALGSVRVSGVLRANNSEALLRLLAADHDIVSEQRADRLVLSRSR
jgi:transmembrane sensor